MEDDQHAPIILVDDDKDDCELFVEACSAAKLPNPVVQFKNALEAFSYLLQMNVRPHFIICDVNIQPIGGLQLRHMVDENERLRFQAIPFLIWSTSGRGLLIKQAYSLNIQGYFQKPDSFEKLVTIVGAIKEYWMVAQRP